MKTLPVLIFSVFAHLHKSGPLQWAKVHIGLFEQNIEEMNEFHGEHMFQAYFCTDSSS